MDEFVAGGADHEGFAASFGHEFCPCGLRLSRLVEVGEFADVVDVHRAGVLAHLAPAG
ncbi:MAG TPA: hypothetical protein VFI46_10225 [Jiangellaceae bacterium]|nr:hypothetical protein [Jiangellaceae bacterium]